MTFLQELMRVQVLFDEMHLNNKDEIDTIDGMDEMLDTIGHEIELAMEKLDDHMELCLGDCEADYRHDQEQDERAVR